MNKIKILIVDDEKLIREGLKLILSTFSDIDIVGTSSNGFEALDFCKNNAVDLVLMDIRMDKCNGVTGTKIIKEMFSQIKILVLTTFDDEEYIKEALNYGASGYLLKDSSHDLIYDGIKSVYKGNVVVHPKVASKIISTSNTAAPVANKRDVIIKDFDLTEREISVIEGIADGLTNKEVAEKLYLSEGTVKNIVTSILLKLNLRDRTQIAIFAYKNSFI